MRRFLLALTLLAAGAAHANDGEFYGSGASVYPVNNDTISMDKETLVIEQMGPMRGGYVDHWLVNVRYEFVNTGTKATTVQMGFPEHCQRMVEDMEVEAPHCKKPAITDFTAKADGRKLPITVKVGKKGEAGALKGTIFDRVHTFKVPFKAGERVVVEHSYTHHGSITSPMHSNVDYILRTGGLWKGPIRDFDMRVVLKAEWKSIINTQPDAKFPKPTFEGWQGGTYQLRWQLKNFTPKSDLALMLHEPVSADAAHALDSLINEVVHIDPKRLQKESLEALRIMRNTPYAILGYTFKNKMLREHFTKQPWYRPRLDYNAKWINADERKFIQAVKAEEARRKK